MNVSIELLEIYYIKIGSTWYTDNIATFLITPIGFIAMCLNFISLIVFQRINNQTNLIKYFRVYTFLSFVACLIGMFYFITSVRYFNFVNTYWISFYTCIVCQYLITIDFYANILNCLILLERISHFKEKLKKFSDYNPYIICLIAFLICNLINLPYIFYYPPREDKEYQDAMADFNLSSSNFTYCGRNQFLQTIPGQIILFIVILIRDFVTLLLEFGISIASIMYFKGYVKKKRSLLILTNQLNLRNNSSCNYESQRYSLSINDFRLNESENFNSKLTKMTIYLALCSLLLHLTVTLSYIISFSLFDNNSLMSNYLSILSLLVASVKYISYFLFYYNFLRSFRYYFKMYICCEDIFKHLDI